MRRALAAAAIATATPVSLSPISTTPGRPASAGDGGLVAVTNSERASAGLPPYSVAADLAGIAQGQAARMAAAHTIFHNPALGSQMCCWQAYGENVGMGPTATSVAQAFLGDASHRANVLSTTFTQVGIAAVTGSDGMVYVDEVFRLPSGAPSPPPPPPPSPAPARPAPSPRWGPPAASRSSTRAALPSLPRRPSAASVFATRLRALSRMLPRPDERDPLRRGLDWSRFMTVLTRGH